MDARLPSRFSDKAVTKDGGSPRILTFMPISGRLACAAASLVLSALPAAPAWGWGRDGHLMINRLAAQNLPADVPAFLRSPKGIDSLEYLGPEPDRWRSHAEEELSSTQAPDHYLDLEWADLAGTPCSPGSPGCGPDGMMLPKKRYDYIRALATAQTSHPGIPLQPDKVGMQPWQVEEIWERLKSDMRDYRHLVATHGDLAPVQNIILFEAGWLGHYVADGSQPLHVTINYNGWVEPTNPNGYTTEHKIHSQFETVYVSANIKPANVAPLVMGSKPMVIDDEWTQYLDYLHHSNSLVEKTYQLDKVGGFTDAGTPSAKLFTEERLAAGAIELRNLIYSAWVRSADPVPDFRGPQ